MAGFRDCSGTKSAGGSTCRPASLLPPSLTTPFRPPHPPPPSTTDKLQQKIAAALKKADGLFMKMRGAWDKLVSNVPSFLKNNSWFQDLTRDIGGPILTGSTDLQTVTCPPNCLDLGVFATMMSFEPRCVCGQAMLTSIKSKLRVAWADTIWSLASLVAIAVAGGWLVGAVRLVGPFETPRASLLAWRGRLTLLYHQQPSPPTLTSSDQPTPTQSRRIRAQAPGS